MGSDIVAGKVFRGDRRGTRIGIPTANILPAAGAAPHPPMGIYAAWGIVGGQTYPAAVSIGVRPTFKTNDAVVIEAHLIGLDAEIYGQNLQLVFVKRLRDEQKFSSTEQLVDQMHQDIEATKRICAANPAPVG